MKTQIIIAGLIATVAVGCAPRAHGPEVVRSSEQSKLATPDFPEMLAMPDPPRENIRQTCRERWPVGNMNLKTFQVRPDRDEFVVKCEGSFDGQRYLCVIRTDKNGHWINDGRTKVEPQQSAAPLPSAPAGPSEGAR
jgi:hypothetical protein